jgi:hypothetical protein
VSWKSRWRFPHPRLREWHVWGVRSLSLSVIAQVVVESPYITSTGRSDDGHIRVARIRTRVSGSAMLVHSDVTNRHASRDLGHGRPEAVPDPARHSPRRAAAMSNVRPFWIAWCCCWAAFWLIIGFFTFGLGWIGLPLSLLAILIPIGAPAQPMPPLPYYPPAPQAWDMAAGGESVDGIAPGLRSTATGAVEGVEAGLGEPARDIDQFDVGVLGRTDQHPEGLFAVDAEPLHEDAFRLPDEVTAGQRLAELPGVVGAVEQQSGLQSEQPSRGARGLVERVRGARVQVQRRADAAVSGQLSRCSAWRPVRSGLKIWCWRPVDVASL